MRKLPTTLPDGDRKDYSLAETARIIGTRVQKPGETLRYTMDKVRKRLVDAIDKGELETIGPAPSLYHLPHVVAWGRGKWPGKLKGLPCASTMILEETGRLHDELLDKVIPGELSRCQEALDEALTQIHMLEDVIKAQQAEIEGLRPDAERYNENCETNTKSAKRPRSGVW